MSMRSSTSLLGLCLATVTAALLSPAAAQQWVMPRTPDGHPDLQGNWTNVTITPFKRAQNQGPVFTAEEVAQREGRAVNAVVRGAQPSDPDRSAPEAGGNIGSYNSVYFEQGMRVAVVNGEYRASLITNPSNGRRPPRTSEAQERLRERRESLSQFDQFDNPENRSLIERCLLFAGNAGPPMIPQNAYNNNYTIVQTADYVMIHPEVIHDTRIIQMGTPDPLPDHVRPWLGDSWGRWEGDVLVVETTNFHPLQTFQGLPSDDLKVIERFTRVDEETILYEFTIDDPTSYTQQWGGEIPFKKLDALLYEYACHEGNYALSNVLSGARYQDRQAEQNR